MKSRPLKRIRGVDSSTHIYPCRRSLKFASTTSFLMPLSPLWLLLVLLSPFICPSITMGSKFLSTIQTLHTRPAFIFIISIFFVFHPFFDSRLYFYFLCHPFFHNKKNKRPKDIKFLCLWVRRWLRPWQLNDAPLLFASSFYLSHMFYLHAYYMEHSFSFSSSVTKNTLYSFNVIVCCVMSVLFFNWWIKYGQMI